MASKTATAATAFDEIAYAAFSTHFRTVYAAQFTPTDDPHKIALDHWNANLPHVATLWHGLVKGVIVNVTEAQNKGIIPPMLVSATAPLAGLGGPLPGQRPETEPAALAKRIAGQLRERQDAARDTVPGLAIGRETEHDT